MYNAMYISLLTCDHCNRPAVAIGRDKATGRHPTALVALYADDLERVLKQGSRRADAAMGGMMSGAAGRVQ